MLSIPKPKFREIVFQILYSYDCSDTTEESIIPFMMKELAVTKRTVRLANERAKEVQKKINDLDKLITQTSLSYEFNRIHTVERNVLRLGTYELLFDNEIPPKVAISEAVRLSKKFSSPESASFVNAILDAIYKQDLGEAVDQDSLNSTASALKEFEEIAHEASLQEKKESGSDE